MAFNIEIIKNKRGRNTVLLRQAWREGKRIRKKTIANLTDLPQALINGIDAVVRGGVAFARLNDAFRIRRALPHGHIAAVLGTAHSIGLERILHPRVSRQRRLALAAIVARVVAPDSKLATARRLSSDTADSALGAVLQLDQVSGNELLNMLDWLLVRQKWIERSLANRYLKDATLILYDVTSSYLEGRCCELAEFGYNRDGKKGKQQIVFGLLCAADGCPIAVEVFAGNTADPATLSRQVRTIQQRFGIERIALVGDRGMITGARIRDDLIPAGLDWVSALTATGLRKLLQHASAGEHAKVIDRLQPDGVVAVSSDEFPGETIMVCLNARLCAERTRKREVLLNQTEQVLEKISQSVKRGTLKGQVNIAKRVGAEINRWKVAKHFALDITDTTLSWRRLADQIAAEAQLDGVYAVRTSVSDLSPHEAVVAYKSLAQVERAFRTTKSHLEVRPIYVYTADHVKAHVFLCMLAYHVQWHMRRRLAPLLFEDDDRQSAAEARCSPVAKAEVSVGAKRKAASKQTPQGEPVHSFSTLLADLATVTLNEVELPGRVKTTMPMLAQHTALQSRAFELLGVDPHRYVPSARRG